GGRCLSPRRCCLSVRSPRAGCEGRGRGTVFLTHRCRAPAWLQRTMPCDGPSSPSSEPGNAGPTPTTRWPCSEFETHDGTTRECPADLREPRGREHGQRTREQRRSTDAVRRQPVDIDGVTFDRSRTMITRVCHRGVQKRVTDTVPAVPGVDHE